MFPLLCAIRVSSYAATERLERILSTFSAGGLQNQKWMEVQLCRVSTVCGFGSGCEVYVMLITRPTIARIAKQAAEWW